MASAFGERCHVDHEAILHIAGEHAIVGVVDGLDGCEKGDTFVRVDDHRQFTVGQVVVIGSGADEEQGVVAAVDTAWRAGKLTLKAPLAYAHEAGTIVSGTGIAFTTPVTKPHPAGALMMETGDLATPGSPNKFVRRGL